MFTAAFFIITQTWKKHKCPLANDWLINVGSSCSLDALCFIGDMGHFRPPLRVPLVQAMVSAEMATVTDNPDFLVSRARACQVPSVL